MRGARVAKRYALALLELADEQNQLEQWGAELARLAGAISAPELEEALTNPELTEQARLEAATKIAERLGLSFPLRSFAVVVARHGRLGIVEAISQSYQALLDERLGRARAKLTFATQPKDSEIQRVVQALEAASRKKVIPTVNVDDKLLGGVVAELEGKIYDASIATRLADAEKRLSQ